MADLGHGKIKLKTDSYLRYYVQPMVHESLYTGLFEQADVCGAKLCKGYTSHRGGTTRDVHWSYPRNLAGVSPI